MSIEEGIQIERSDEHPANVNSSRMEIAQPYSKAKYESTLQFWKQDFEIASMEEGIQIYRSENASDEKELSRPRIENRRRRPPTQPVPLGNSCCFDCK
jgi:hypothetical protein